MSWLRWHKGTQTMENLITLWASSGVAQIELGQIVMMG
ncbi:MAG: hypothetical protein ACI89F_000712, partial [Porticoccaceae bacterium]